MRHGVCAGEGHLTRRLTLPRVRYSPLCLVKDIFSRSRSRIMACEVERTGAAYNKALQWDLPTASLTHQFANIYFARQANLSKPLRAAAERKFGKVAKTPVRTLDAEPGSEAVIIGTVYRDMKRKPNILADMERDLFEDRPEAEDGASNKYCSEGDRLMIEDESGRIALTGPKVQDCMLVTGVVVAVRGTVNEAGELELEDVCLPGLPPQQKL